jgi:hypothetical protein
VRLLILSFYYRPDLSAGSFRTTALVEALRERAAAGTEIDVVTTLPNRYHSFVRDAAEVEIDGGCEIRRTTHARRWHLSRRAAMTSCMRLHLD